MEKSEYRGKLAPNKGTKLRTNSIGVAVFSAPALRNFPPPEFLTDTQKSLWIAALADVQVEFFRARHIPMMIQYVRAVEKMMTFSDRFEEDIEDEHAMKMWVSFTHIVSKLERILALDARTLMEAVVRSRTALKDSFNERRTLDVESDERDKRKGLVYDSDSGQT